MAEEGITELVKEEKSSSARRTGRQAAHCTSIIRTLYFTLLYEQQPSFPLLYRSFAFVRSPCAAGVYNMYGMCIYANEYVLDRGVAPASYR